jgi:hypothetical protein
MEPSRNRLKTKNVYIYANQPILESMSEPVFPPTQSMLKKTLILLENQVVLKGSSQQNSQGFYGFSVNWPVANSHPIPRK